MLMEHWILAAMWPLGIVGFFLFIPKKKRRKGFLAFLMFQAIVWLCDMPSFQFGLISAPVRVLPKATDITITINYLFYPVLFSIYYVKKRVKSSIWSKLKYFFVWISSLTLFDAAIEKYTDLLHYGLINGYGMGVYLAFLFYVSEICCNWFFKDKSLFQAERWDTE